MMFKTKNYNNYFFTLILLMCANASAAVGPIVINNTEESIAVVFAALRNFSMRRLGSSILVPHTNISTYASNHFEFERLERGRAVVANLSVCKKYLNGEESDMAEFLIFAPEDVESEAVFGIGGSDFTDAHLCISLDYKKPSKNRKPGSHHGKKGKFTTR